MNLKLLSCGNAIELMRHLPDKCVDMVFTEPPYDKKHQKKGFIFEADSFWREIRRVTSDNAAILLWGQPMFSYRIALSAPDIYRYEWVVERIPPTAYNNAGKKPAKAHELVLVFYKRLPCYNPVKVNPANGTTLHLEDGIRLLDGRVKCPGDVVRFNWKDAIDAPYKPVDACEYFIRTYTKPGMTVLDPFMGCGVTGKGCAIPNAERAFIGFEEDVSLFDKAVMGLCNGN